MAQRSFAPGRTRSRPGHSGRGISRMRGKQTPADFEQQCFEYDRRIVVKVLDTLWSAISQGAVQMETVAEERVFEQSLSADFLRTAQRLHRMERTLEELLLDIGNATGYPRIAAAHSPQRVEVRRLPSRQV